MMKRGTAIGLYILAWVGHIRVLFITYLCPREGLSQES